MRPSTPASLCPPPSSRCVSVQGEGHTALVALCHPVHSYHFFLIFISKAVSHPPLSHTILLMPHSFTHYLCIALHTPSLHPHLSFTGLGHPRKPCPLHPYSKLSRPHLCWLPRPQHSVPHTADATRGDSHHRRRHLHRHQHPVLCCREHCQDMGSQEVSMEGGVGFRMWEKRN